MNLSISGDRTIPASVHAGRFLPPSQTRSISLFDVQITAASAPHEPGATPDNSSS